MTEEQSEEGGGGGGGEGISPKRVFKRIWRVLWVFFRVSNLFLSSVSVRMRSPTAFSTFLGSAWRKISYNYCYCQSRNNIMLKI